MKKKEDLKIPFSFEDRRPIVIDRFFLVPRNYTLHHKWEMPNFSDKVLFGDNKKVFIEYCSGNGDWIVERARERRDINWIAVEMKFDRARKIWLKMHNQNIENLLVVFGEAYTFTKFYLEEGAIGSIYINFPDPWPKKRHAKNRLVTDLFSKEIFRVVLDGGRAIIVTDDEEASSWMSDAMVGGGWEPLSVSENISGYGKSFFDTLWRSKGKKIFYHSFLKK